MKKIVLTDTSAVITDVIDLFKKESNAIKTALKEIVKLEGEISEAFYYHKDEIVIDRDNIRIGLLYKKIVILSRDNKRAIKIDISSGGTIVVRFYLFETPLGSASWLVDSHILSTRAPDRYLEITANTLPVHAQSFIPHLKGEKVMT